jgi:multidrug efflux pump subunit AcrA (membrane-fusion protein)
MARTNSRNKQTERKESKVQTGIAFLKTGYATLGNFFRRKPLTTFIVTFVLLILVLGVGNYVTKQQAQTKTKTQVRTIHIYSIGVAPKVTFQAKIEKSGVVKIIAQTAGIVQNIQVKEGDTIYSGGQLLSLSSNYQGGNAPALQTQIARTQYDNFLQTLDLQKSSLQTQRDIATASAENAARQREIARQSNDDTNSLIDANQQQLDVLNQSLSVLQLNPPSASGSAQMQETEGVIIQLQSAIDQLRASQRNLSLQGAEDKPPALLANFQKDVTMKQLDLQEKTLNLNKEVSKLQIALSEVAESLMYPASPIAGTVNRIFVHVGQMVSPGTPLAVISATDPHATAIVTAPQKIAGNVSRLESSDLFIGGHVYPVVPSFVSGEATDGLLYSLFYPVPEDATSQVSDGEYITVNIPVGMPDTGATVPFVPIDAVYQTQDKAYLMVVRNKKAETRTVTLGAVFGGFVEVTSGLKSGDQVILERNIVAGDIVKIDE